MAAFLSQTELSRGGLKLFLSNDLGQPQDAAAVRWTVYSASGEQMSGKGLPAVKSTVGEYYAPWFTDVPGGSYRIEWEVEERACSTARVFRQDFFVVNPDMYTACGIIPSVVVGKGTYRYGQQLTQSDLTLFLKNDDGFLQDAYAVFWSIRDAAGRTVSARAFASRSDVGSYFAPWLVSAQESGDYQVFWEFQRDADGPLQSMVQGFYVLTTCPAFSIVLSPACCEPNPDSCTEVIQKKASPVFIVPCGSGFAEREPDFFACATSRPCAPCLPPAPVPPVMPNPSPSACCSYEIPRIVHIPTGVLPAGGAFTSQPQFPIPTGIRHVTFYITYTRGAPQGFAAFRLLWGNGQDEHQETVIDTEVQDDSLTAAQSMFLQNLEGPVPVDGLPVNFVLYVTVPGGSNRVRLLAAEKGMPGLPGTIGVTLTAST